MVFEDYLSSWFSEIAHVGIVVDRRFRVCFAELKMGQAFLSFAKRCLRGETVSIATKFKVFVT